MKKSVKIGILLAIIALAIIVLVGCGSKLVATRSSEETEETYEVKFKGNNISEVKITYDCHDTEVADVLYGIYNGEFGDPVDGMKAERKENKIIVTMNQDAFITVYTTSDGKPDTSKEGVRKLLEDSGYSVK